MVFSQRLTLLSALVIAALLTGSGGLARGQAAASANGIATDPTGAVVPGAKIEIVNMDTGLRREAATNAAGRYLFAQIAPGRYEFTARAEGFQNVIVSDVQLQVNTPLTLNITFEKIGEVTESVTVSAEAAQVNTTDASLGNVISTRPITQLPLLARNPVNLLALQPGVTQFGGEGGDVSGSTNGGKADQANIVLDGVDVNDQLDRRAFTPALRVTLESVQEFRSTTMTPTADQGRGSGAQVSMVTRSGTNELHGSLYAFHRNTVTAANDYFNNLVGLERPKLLINVFGGSVGGPVMKNRLFFFFNYEGRRDASDSQETRTVPSLSVREGVIKYLRTDGGVGQIFPDQLRQMDKLGLGPNTKVLEYFRSFPAPNDSTIGDGLNSAGFRFSTPQKSRENTYVTRWDWVMDSASKHTLFFRGNLQDDRDDGVPQFPGDPPQSSGLDNSRGAALGYNVILSPDLMGTFRYGLTRISREYTGLQTQSMISFRGLDDRYPTSTGGSRIAPTHTLAGDLSWTKGAHNLQFGAVMRRNQIKRRGADRSFDEVMADYTELSDIEDYYNLLPDLADGYRSPLGGALAWVLGVLPTGAAQYNFDINGKMLGKGDPVVRDFRSNEYELYIQDTWRATRALTVSAGVRWSLMPPFYEANGAQTTIIPGLNEYFHKRAAYANAGIPSYKAGLLSYVPRDSPQGKPLYPFHKKDVAPRIGLAFSPQSTDGWKGKLFGGPGKTSIRLGWGMLYDLFGSGLARWADETSPGFSYRFQTPGTAYSSETAPRFTGVFNLPSEILPPPPKPGWPQTLEEGAGAAFGGAVDDKILAPYTMNMSFSIGRELPGGLYIQGAYVGRLSRRSLAQVDVAQPVNFTDPVSGQNYLPAVHEMIRLVKAKTPVAQVPPIPWYENLFPGAAGGGRTATQALYPIYVGRAPARWMAISPFDTRCWPTCTRFGPYTFFTPQYYALGTWMSIGNGNYHAMQWTVRKRFSKGLTADLNYTWSKSIDLTSRPERREISYGDNLMINSWDFSQHRAVSNYDAAHQVNANWVWELPIGRGQRLLGGAGAGLDALVGGWQVSGLYFQSSPLPATVDSGYFPTNWNVPAWATPIKDVPATGVDKNAPQVAGGSGPNIWSNPMQALESYDFTLPGQAGQRNGVRGDGFWNVDFALMKRIVMPYAENHSLQIRWETFNLFNSVSFGNPSLNISSPGSFGKLYYTRSSPRQMQFALRYEF